MISAHDCRANGWPKALPWQITWAAKRMPGTPATLHAQARQVVDRRTVNRWSVARTGAARPYSVASRNPRHRGSQGLDFQYTIRRQAVVVSVKRFARNVRLQIVGGGAG